ncbi:MAG TPA: hypothetical protein VK806_03010 [Bacteroidia bacterium]|jgi:hypothetical protein|nr:hypothetical protein [Bacteroidia bacterium]
MSACDPINIPFQGAVSTYLEKAKSKITQMSGTINGNETVGNFEVNSPIGMVAGNYAVNGQTFTITITEKPMMLGCGMIEGLLKGALS